MEWLKDPKNQPVVAGILIGVILVVAVLMYFLYFKPPSAEPVAVNPAAPEPTAPQPMAPTPAPATPAAPAPGTPSGPQMQMVSTTPIEAWRPDPFLPLGYKPPPPTRKSHPPITDLPVPGPIFPWHPPEGDNETLELAQPARRMAGLLVNSGVYAIIESNGESEIVRPGDTLKDRLATVEKIERDKVILKTKDVKPRYIVIRMASSPRGGASSSSGGPSAGPMNRPGAGEPMGVRSRVTPGGRVSGSPMDTD